VRETDDLTTFMCSMSWKSGSPNLLEPSGPHRACNGMTLPFYMVSESLCFPWEAVRYCSNTCIWFSTHSEARRPCKHRWNYIILFPHLCRWFL